MKIVSWNINSVRLRINLLAKLSNEQRPDIICLQETKVQDKDFPLEKIKEIGYPHVIFSGEKSYNGVAILSKLPLSDVQMMEFSGSTNKRHISAALPDGTIVHNFYIPAGGDEPDVEINPKFKFKLEFVDYLTEFFAKNHKKTDKIIIVGDFNIAPFEHDVWSSKSLRKVVSHTVIERDKIGLLSKSLDWVDVARHFVPMEEKAYSWWSYRNRDWTKSNRGRRLDHIWITPELKSKLASYKVISDARSWEKPSDHAPIVAEINL